MTNQKIFMEIIQYTYDLESMLRKVMSIETKMYELTSKLNESTLSDNEKELLGKRISAISSLLGEVNV